MMRLRLRMRRACDETVPVSVIKVGKSSTAAIPQEDGDSLLPGFMRRLCGRETAHALAEMKGKAKDKFYGKLILDLGNEMRSSVEHGTAAMERLAEKLGNVEDKSAPMTQASIRRMIKESINTTIATERARQANVKMMLVDLGQLEELSNCEDGLRKHRVYLRSVNVQRVRRRDTTYGARVVNLKIKEYDIVAYTQRFNELALMCRRMVKEKE
ncbi:hypothetical protein Tco_0266028 [Tanacetum coccineum]